MSPEETPAALSAPVAPPMTDDLGASLLEAPAPPAEPGAMSTAFVFFIASPSSQAAVRQATKAIV
jgi:hypothetical protein